VSYWFAIHDHSFVMAPMSIFSRFIILREVRCYHTSLFEPEQFNSFESLQELVPYEHHIYFEYDAFGHLICDSPSPVSPWHQNYWYSGKNGTMLEVDDAVLKNGRPSTQGLMIAVGNVQAVGPSNTNAIQNHL